VIACHRSRSPGGGVKEDLSDDKSRFVHAGRKITYRIQGVGGQKRLLT